MINLGAAFEQDLIALAGWNPNSVDTGSTQIDLINTAGQTTVRATATATVDTAALQALIVKYATPAATDDTDTGASTGTTTTATLNATSTLSTT